MNLHNFFKDKKGKTVIFQKPNFLVWIAIIFLIMQFLFSGNLGNIANWGFKLTVIFWSLDEFLRGVNLFRKTLGIIILLFVLYGIFWN